MLNLKNNCKKIVAVGRNFLAHAHELGNKVESKPVIFLKPSSCIIESGQLIEIPSDTDELHHEVELGIVIDKVVRKVNAEDVMSSIRGYVMALDLTDRKLQTELKSKQLPWSLAKGFDTSCPIGSLLPIDALPREFLSTCRRKFNTVDVPIWLDVNGMERQRSSLSHMIWTPAELVVFISQRFTLEPGDLILTGTPSGVGPIRSGDRIHFGLGDRSAVEFCVK